MGRWIGDRPLFILSVLLTVIGIQFVSTGLLGELMTSVTHKRDQEVPMRRVLDRGNNK
jgi:hypothetical protein